MLHNDMLSHPLQSERYGTTLWLASNKVLSSSVFLAGGVQLRSHAICVVTLKVSHVDESASA